MESMKCQRILKVSFYQIVFDGAAPILGKKSSEGELGRTKEMPLLGCFRYLFESTLSRGKCTLPILDAIASLSTRVKLLVEMLLHLPGFQAC